MMVEMVYKQIYQSYFRWRQNYTDLNDTPVNEDEILSIEMDGQTIDPLFLDPNHSNSR